MQEPRATRAARQARRISVCGRGVGSQGPQTVRLKPTPQGGRLVGLTDGSLHRSADILNCTLVYSVA
jgi:hypothetical protein